MTGRLIENTKEGTWEILLDNASEVLQRSFGDEEVAQVIVKNMKDEYKQHGLHVKTSGIVTLKAYITSKTPGVGAFTYKYDYEIADIETTNVNAKTRASIDGEELECMTPSADPPMWIYTKSNETNRWFYNYKFRIYVHVVRSSNGDGLSKTIASDIVTSLNKYYSGTHVSFTLLGSDYIDNNTYYLMTSSKEDAEALFKNNSRDDAIEIYVISNGAYLNAAGSAQGIPSTAYYVNNEYYKESTLAHEMGHCLGLWHTHHGTYHEDDTGIPEFVNGTNSAWAGDYIVDTPADPNKWSGGKYAGGDLTDANGDKYNPDPTNLMSYNMKVYRTKFTTNQIERIHDFIQNTPELKQRCIISSLTVSGPKLFYNPTEYSVDVPDSYNVTWTVKCETFTSKTKPTITTYTASGRTFTLSNKISDAVSQRYTLTADIVDDYGNSFQCSKKVYRVIPNFTTGTFKWSSESTGGGGFVGTLTSNGYTQNTVKVYQGGSLFFSYKDACGLESDQSSDFNFGLYGNYNFSKVTGSNNGYQHTGSVGGKATLSVTIGEQNRVIPLTISVLKTSVYVIEEQDSISISSHEAATF